MIRSTLIVCAGIIGAACFLPMSASSPGLPIGTAAMAAPACDAASFLAKASYLSVPFTPSPGSAPPPTSPLPASYKAGLIAAFNAASPAFQQRLCNLDAVYVNAVSCTTPGECHSGSWGWRQSKPTVGAGRVVAISTILWTEGTYSRYETDLTQSLLPSVGIAFSAAQSCSPSGACAPVDNLAMALLAALAHETGHIRWYDLVEPNPNSFCDRRFFGYSWALPIHSPPLDESGHPFRHLLTFAEREKLRFTHRWFDHHKNVPLIEKIDHPERGDPPVSQMVHQLVATASPWPSPFAAMSPDEDFVETYTFKVLTTANPPLTSATITVPGADTADIAADYVSGKKTELTAKVACIPASF
jgi:hypothetical protein